MATGITHSPVFVDDGNACTIDACSVATGVIHTPVNVDDGNLCTTDSCNPATGVSHAPVNVDDGNPCTTDACDPVFGVTHSAVNPDDGNPCTVDTCNGVGGVIHTPVNVNDNNACTTDACNPANGAVTHTPIVCNDNNACTADSCNPASGCVYTAGGYFSDDFSGGNAKGWTLGTQWAIGALPANPIAPSGNPDPTLDHSPTADNFVAGVVLGGSTGTTLHAPYYLTSPIINLSGAAGTVILDFWRYLNSDYPSYMNSTIEVYNGVSWVTVFTMTAGVSIADLAWTRQQIDVTAHKNANFRVRWGYSIDAAGVFDVSGWNIDDVRLNPQLNCP
jgi:hypothetical protein